MQWETKSRQAGETWHDDSLLEVPTTILKFPHLPFYHSSSIPDDRPPRAGARTSRISFSFSVSFGVAHGGLGGAQLRLKTYDAVIFIAFRRLYAHLNFNASRARTNFVLLAETRTKTRVRCRPLSFSRVRRR